MILVTGQEESDRNIAYIMVFKYRKAYLTKEEAEKVSKEELDDILKSVSQIKETSLKEKQIFESLKLYHYYPAPEYYSDWENEWNINF